MRYLLDTNVISEFATSSPHESVVDWFQTHENDDLYLSVITIGEIQQGIARLPASKKQALALSQKARTQPFGQNIF